MPTFIPPPAAAEAFLLGSEQASEGRYDEAEAAFANTVLLAPDWTIARYQLGLLQLSSGRAAVALVTWEPLMALDASDPLGHYVRGFDALVRDEFEQATSHFHSGLACPQENEAVAGDIEKVLARIAATKPSIAAEAPAKPQDPTPAHVLVANYGRMGNLH